MRTHSDINQPIVEGLYTEALVLADNVRQVFDLNPVQELGEEADLTRLALSVEGLRTTTRVMHVLAWLLNYRAFFAGELTEFQLRRHTVLPADRMAEADNLVRLEAPTRALIEDSIQLHARVSRLDTAWRKRFEQQPTAVQQLQDRLGEAITR